MAPSGHPEASRRSRRSSTRARAASVPIGRHPAQRVFVGPPEGGPHALVTGIDVLGADHRGDARDTELLVDPLVGGHDRPRRRTITTLLREASVTAGKSVSNTGAAAKNRLP